MALGNKQTGNLGHPTSTRRLHHHRGLRSIKNIQLHLHVKWRELRTEGGIQPIQALLHLKLNDIQNILLATTAHSNSVQLFFVFDCVIIACG